MLDGFRRDLPAFLKHVLDQVDAAARTIEFVAEQHVGRAGRGAKPAMDAAPQDFFRLRDIRVGELGQRKLGLQLVRFSGFVGTMRPGLRICAGSNPSLTRRDNAAREGGSGSNTAMARRSAAEPFISVACPVPLPSFPRIARRIASAPASLGPAVSGTDAQTSPPPQSSSHFASRVRARASPNSAPRAGATEMRHTACSPGLQ